METDHHLEQALAVGAHFAQGYRFGRAAPLNRHHCIEGQPRIVHPARRGAGSPNTAAGESRKALRVARKEIVTAFSRHIEEQARHSVDHPMVLAAVQGPEHFSEFSRLVYRDLAAMSPLVVVFGRDMPADLGGGIRGVALRSDDPLCDEWAVVTLGADTCRALVARELSSPTSQDADRRFEYLITSDRALVTRAARSLLARVV